MSLDVYLTVAEPVPQPTGSGIFIREDGRTREISRDEWEMRFPDREPVVYLPDQETESCKVYSANITHNLTKMADQAGLYEALWRPEELDIETAEQLIPLLQAGLFDLKNFPDRFKQFNPSNGWGDYDGLVAFVTDYLTACKRWPNAKVNAWR